MKLDIIGSVASGKTTLAREISTKYQMPFYEKDNIVWARTLNGDRKRSPKERDRIFTEIIKSDNWIVEGSPRKNLRESFKYCDYIILLDVNIWTRLFRVFRRWIRQKRGKEGYNSKPTLKFLYFNIKWVFEYNVEREAIIKDLTKYGTKFKVFHNSKQALQFIDGVYSFT
ncbi:MAG: DNA topology modulation protein FlaR [Clostridium sp.]|nr:DNA topology modulation protein FlaR [Clostridium sp.]